MYRISVGCVEMGAEEHRQVNDVLDSGWVSPGPKVALFEQKFSKRHDCNYGVMMNSGTDALRIALATLKEVHGWQDGDEVIVPALTFVATVNVILQNNLKPVFVDVDSLDFNLDVDLIQKARTTRTRAIIPVHLFGLMADMYQIRRESDGLKIIEDSCETMGTQFVGAPEGNVGFGRDGKVGSFGDISCFSTYACHLIVTGVGGIAITNNHDYDQVMRSFVNHGRDPYFLGGFSQQDRKPGIELIRKRFLYHRVGYSSRVSEFEAALGLAQLDRLNAIVARRQHHATLLRQLLRPVEDTLQLPNVIPVNRTNAWMMFPIVIKDDSIDRDVFCLYLERKGIETRPLMPLLTQPVYVNMWGRISRNFPVAHRAQTKGFYVGCHQQLTDVDLDFMSRTIRDAVTIFSKKTHARV